MPNEKRWDREWKERHVIDDIRMQDFFSGRQYICKFFPWWGRALEAGCGLGRYVFYFSALGRDIVGVDFSSESVAKAQALSQEQGFDPTLFGTGNVEDLQFEASSFSYYISLGVLEHFYEGPQKALSEALRVLEPGGMLLVTTPNKYSLETIRGSLKYSIKSMWQDHGDALALFTLDPDGDFFQYWFSRSQIAGFIRAAGFEIVETATIDLRYPVYQKMRSSAWCTYLWGHQELMNALEASPFRLLGGNSVIVAMKPGAQMRCFFCGVLKPRTELKHHTARIPVCNECRAVYQGTLGAYSRGVDGRYFIGADALTTDGCGYCGSPVMPHPLFAYYGFDRQVCPTCLHDPEIRGELFAHHVRLTWKPYQEEN